MVAIPPLLNPLFLTPPSLLFSGSSLPHSRRRGGRLSADARAQEDLQALSRTLQPSASAPPPPPPQTAGALAQADLRALSAEQRARAPPAPPAA